MSNISVFGIYHTREAAEEAVSALRQARFRNTDMSALFPDNIGSKDFALEKNSKAPEGAITGAAAGVIAGGIVGWLAGAGTLAIPGIAPYLNGGPIVSALAAAGALGIIAAIVGAIVGAAMPEYEARRYRGRVKHSGVLLSVHCDNHDWVKRAAATLKRTGAESVASATEAPADYGDSERPAPRTRTSITDDPDYSHSLFARTPETAETPEKINPDGYRDRTAV
jgi:hypothetical protein